MVYRCKRRKRESCTPQTDENGGGILKFKLVEASSEDFAEISRLHLQVHDLHIRNRLDLFRKEDNYTLDYTYFHSLLDDELSKVFIVKDEHNQVLAYTFLKVEETPIRPILVPRRTIYMNDLCVDEKYQGRGLGKLLFERAKDYAKAVGAVSLELGVLSFNEHAIEFYRRMGMRTKVLRMELEI